MQKTSGTGLIQRTLQILAHGQHLLMLCGQPEFSALAHVEHIGSKPLGSKSDNESDASNFNERKAYTSRQPPLGVVSKHAATQPRTKPELVPL